MPVSRPVRWRRLRARTGWTLTAVAALLAVGSALMFALRFVSPDALPLAPDTVAMVAAFSDFAVAGFALALLLAAVATLVRFRRGQIAVAALCAAAMAVSIAPLVPRWTRDAAVTSSTSFTLLALNSWKGGADPVELTAAARSADVVVLTETTERQIRALTVAGFTDRFTHRVPARLPERGAAGTAVFSRFPITGGRRLSPRLHLQNWVCSVAVPGLGPVEIVAVHPTRPSVGETGWLPEQRELQARLPESGLRLIAGDFNAVASHPTLRALTDSGWTSSVDQAGAGWVPTFPANSAESPPLIDIDHVYAAPGLHATQVNSVPISGTDHLGLLVVLAGAGA